MFETRNPGNKTSSEEIVLNIRMLERHWMWRYATNPITLKQGYVKERFKSSLRKIYGRYGDHITLKGIL